MEKSLLSTSFLLFSFPEKKWRESFQGLFFSLVILLVFSDRVALGLSLFLPPSLRKGPLISGLPCVLNGTFLPVEKDVCRQ